MNLIEKINLISEQAKDKFKPDLKKYGKNFRAISESAVLDVLNPLLKEQQIAYEVIIKKSDLRIEKIKAGRDQAGNLIEKLVFIAEVVVRLVITDLIVTIDYPPLKNPLDSKEPMIFNHATTMEFEGYGSGVDAGDKATGKALTAAVKYALFKGFRLQYSDDPDAEASEDIENIIDSPIREEKSHDKAKEAPKPEPRISEKQLDYILGLGKDLGYEKSNLEAAFSCAINEKLSMRKAREIIKFLEEEQKKKIPF